MPLDDPADDEDWYDAETADDQSDETEEIGLCPECRGPVYEFTNKCSSCGYYLTESDHRRLWSNRSKPIWVLITAVVVLAILILGALTLNF